MFREALTWDRGMLFIFEDQEKHGFWMKNMLFPIDIIWIDQDKRVVDMAENAMPCAAGSECPTLMPKKPAKYVLEVSSGFAKRHGIKIGDKLVF